MLGRRIGKTIKKKTNTSTFRPTTHTSTFRPETYRSDFKPAEYGYTPPPDEDIRTGGETTSRLLTGTLEGAQRRARLSGRDLSEGDIEGLSRGFYSGAGERLTARRGLALQKRGQDIQAGLGYAGLTSAEKMKGGELGLGYKGLTSAEKMKGGELELGYTGLTSAERMKAEEIASAERISRQEIKSAKWLGQLQAKTTRHQVKETRGFLGGGGFLGTGWGQNVCIIITACTNPNSEEVNITRRYRDKIMLLETLRGYYILAELVVPLIHKSGRLKRFLKKHLVDSLAATCGWKLGEQETPSWKARIITGVFLGGCNLLGHTKPQFVRSNGEVF